MALKTNDAAPKLCTGKRMHCAALPLPHTEADRGPRVRPPLRSGTQGRGGEEQSRPQHKVHGKVRFGFVLALSFPR